MKSKRIRNHQSVIAITLIVCMLFTLIVQGNLKQAIAAEVEPNTTILMEIGVPDLKIVLTDNEGNAYEGITNEEGSVEFDELYEYLLQKGFNPDTEMNTGSEITIKYDINYGTLSEKDKADKTNANARFEGRTGEIILTDSFAEGKYLWNRTIQFDPLQRIEYVEGTFFHGKDAAKDAEVIAKFEGETYKTKVGSDGKFSFYPDLKVKDADKITLEVIEDEIYKDYSKTAAEFIKDGNTIVLEERFLADSEDYTLDSRIKDSYIREDKLGKYVITGAKGNKLSTSIKGPFNETVEVTVTKSKDSYTTTPFFVQRKNGDISQPVMNIIKVDGKAPVISEISDVKVQQDSGLSFLLNAFGIFGHDDATVKVEMKAKDLESGISNVELIGYDKEGNESKRYPSTRAEITKETVSAEFKIKDTGIVKQNLKIVATDNMEYSCEPLYIRKNKEASSIYIEKEPPVISEIKSSEANSNGWFDGEVKFAFNVTDTKSGIQKVDIFLNGDKVKGDSLNRITTEKKYDFTLSEELIKKYANEKDEYTITVEALDNSGNKVSESKSVKVDITKPEISITGIKNNAFTKQAPEISVTSNEKNYKEEGAEIKFQVLKDGSSLMEKAIFLTDKVSINKYVDITADGTYTVIANSKDAAGNAAEEKRLIFTVDKTSPVISTIEISEKPSIFSWFNKELAFDFDVKDLTSGLNKVKATINGKNVLDKNINEPFKSEDHYTIKLTKKLIEELINDKGEYTLKVVANDYTGNEIEEVVTIKDDIVKPSVKISGVEEGALLQKYPSIEITNNEKHFNEEGAFIYAKVSRNGKSVLNKEFEKADKVNLEKLSEDGIYTVLAGAKDAATNTSLEQHVTFTKDATKPVISDIKVNGNKSENDWYNDKATFTFSINDETSGLKDVDISINGKTITKKVYDFKTTDKKEYTIELTKELIKELINENGKYTISVKATDHCNNTSSKEMSVHADIVSPVVTLSGIEEGKHTATTPVIEIKNDEKHFNVKGSKIVVNIILDDKEFFNKEYHRENKINLNNFKTDGKYKLSIYAVDAAGNKSKVEKLSFIKDSTSPVIEISGADNNQNYNQAKKISISVEERHFSSNKVTIGVTRTLEGRTYSENFNWENKGEKSISSKVFSETGTYMITVNAEDEAGNKAVEKRLKFTVDTIPPTVEINGVTDKIYAYDDVVAPSISYHDSYFARIDVNVTKNGESWSSKLEKSDTGSKINFRDFNKAKENDGNYTLTVVCKDIVGNTTEKTVNFTVNRFGSAFIYDNSLNNINKKYHKEIAQSFTITEHNVSRVIESEIEVKKDGEAIKHNVSRKNAGSNATGNSYEYLFNKDIFDNEGVYQINIITKDEAGNATESTAEAGNVKFYVDKTAPIMDINGLQDKYVKSDSQEVVIKAIDNLSPVDVKVLVNEKEITVSEENETIMFTLNEGLSQKVKITAVDKAGNVTTQVEEISVIPSSFLFYVVKFKYAIIGVGFALLAAIGLILYKRKNKKGSKEKEKAN